MSDILWIWEVSEIFWEDIEINLIIKIESENDTLIKNIINIKNIPNKQLSNKISTIVIIIHILYTQIRIYHSFIQTLHPKSTTFKLN